MPWIDEDPNAISLPVAMGVERPPEPMAPKLDEIVSAAFGRDNLVYNAGRKLMEERYPPDPGYNPLDDERVKGTRYEAQYASNFIYSYSPQDTARIIADINREERNNATLAAGGWVGIGASVVAGMVDPTLLIPGSIGIKAGKGGYEFVRAAASAALAGAAQGALYEGGMGLAQQLRTRAESAFNIGTNTLLSPLGGRWRKLYHD